MIAILVSYATPEKQLEIPVLIQNDCTVKLAIQESQLLSEFPDINLDVIEVGIYGKKVSLNSKLKANDRIEIYRPLIIDPKQARKLRAIKK